VVVDEADYMEAVGDDQRLGKLLLHDRTVDHRQVHANDADLLFSF
jgi:hypothetical protein